MGRPSKLTDAQKDEAPGKCALIATLTELGRSYAWEENDFPADTPTAGGAVLLSLFNARNDLN